MSGFGRKGLEQYASQAHQTGHSPDAGLDSLRNAARGPLRTQPRGGATSPQVEAFLASERARKVEASGAGTSDFAASYRSADRPARSLPLAYLLWFILGQVSAHRFYLGAYRSAIAQVGLFAFWVLVAIGSPEGSYNTVGPVLAIAMIGWALWVLGDVFFIHRIHRNLCRKPTEAAASFA